MKPVHFLSDLSGMIGILSLHHPRDQKMAAPGSHEVVHRVELVLSLHWSHVLFFFPNLEDFHPRPRYGCEVPCHCTEL